MSLPPRVYFTLIEAAARWNCTVADIAGWASVGRLSLDSLRFQRRTSCRCSVAVVPDHRRAG
jgi:hypothetical protein